MKASAEMYFDESEDEPHKLLCVAGYVFRKEKAEALELMWRETLTSVGLTHFHMVECAHGVGMFEGWNKSDRIALQIRLFDILKEHVETGVAISFDLRFSDLCPSAISQGIEIVSPYSLCGYFSIMHSRHWAKHNSFDGKVAYFFEAGHASKSQLNVIMDGIFALPWQRDFFRYAGHAFLEKQSSGALQCADILAWQWAKNVKDRMEGISKPRADLWSLLEKPHFTIHFDEPTILELLETIKRGNTIAKSASEIFGKYGV